MSNENPKLKSAAELATEKVTLESVEGDTESKGYAHDLEKLLAKFSELKGVREMTVGSDLAPDIQTIAEVHKFLRDPNILEAEKVKLYESNPQFSASKNKIEQYLKDFKKTTEVTGVKKADIAGIEPIIASSQDMKQENLSNGDAGESIQAAEVPENLESKQELETAVEKAMKKTEPRLRTAVEIAMERTNSPSSETGSAAAEIVSSQEEPEKKLKTAKEVAMEKADAILREAENEVVAKKAEESPVDSLSSMKERLERLKQINPEEGMFQSIGTKKERKKALAEMIFELENEISAKEAAEKEMAQAFALKQEKGERLERLKQINPEEGMFQSIGTKKERRKTLEKMISGLVKETGEREEAASKEKANSTKPEAKKAKGGFWRRLFGGS